MASRSQSGAGAAFAAVTVLFFAWGFITSMVDPLVASVKGIFTLTDVQAQMAAAAFFTAYGLTSFLGAALLAKIKSVPTILFALTTMIVGCLVMLLAANVQVFALVLLGLFILASGITVLQVAANPLAAALGDPKYSHFRLTLSQTFNSIGTVIGPILGSELFLKGLEVKHGTVVTDAVRAQALAGIDMAYFWFAGLILALLLFFWVSRRVVSAAAPASVGSGNFFALIGDAFSSKWALFGGLAIFLYVGAEVAIGTQMALFLNSDAVWGKSDALFALPFIEYAVPQDGVVGLSLEQAGKATALYWLGAVVGRAIGSVLLARINAAKLLTTFTAVAAGLCFYVFAIGGVTAGYAALSIGLFNSIMFPVIFTLTLERSTASEAATSGLLCTAIVGGAAVPLLVGLVSGANGYVFALIVPALCYVALCLFAIGAGKAKVLRAEGEMASIH
ncbi:MFS transporter [Sphingomonas sp. LB-2]|uniref:MFS transporter n=1 Tax=Sphingomonas caeni TaxID=2984949 RepID=UPI00223207B3|nr:MFS transporter [Sphingomonas caeni]MCW3848230.1 MFS transporter [Sphingomonas caeni]